MTSLSGDIEPGTEVLTFAQMAALLPAPVLSECSSPFGKDAELYEARQCTGAQDGGARRRERTGRERGEMTEGNTPSRVSRGPGSSSQSKGDCRRAGDSVLLLFSPIGHQRKTEAVPLERVGVMQSL